MSTKAGESKKASAPRSFTDILKNAAARALGGGLPGAAAMLIQVL